MDFSGLIYNILLISFLGIFVAFNPMLIVVDVFLVLKSKRPIFNTILLIAGFALSLALMFFIASSIVEPGSQVSLSRIKNDLKVPPLIDIIAGGVLLVYALKKYQQFKTSPPSALNQKLKIPENTKGIFLFAFIKNFLSVTNVFAILILAKLAAESKWSIARGMTVLVIVLLIGLLPILYIMYLHWFKRESLISIDKRINSLMSRANSNLLVYALFLISLVFLLHGVIKMNN